MKLMMDRKSPESAKSELPGFKIQPASRLALFPSHRRRSILSFTTGDVNFKTIVEETNCSKLPSHSVRDQFDFLAAFCRDAQYSA